MLYPLLFNYHASAFTNQPGRENQWVVQCSPLPHTPSITASTHSRCSRAHTLWDTCICVFQVHEWRAEILLSLGTLAQDVRSARTQSQPGCRFNLLERLERSINNYLHVVRLLYIEVRMTNSTLHWSSDRYWRRDKWHADRLRASWGIHSHRKSTCRMNNEGTGFITTSDLTKINKYKNIVYCTHHFIIFSEYDKNSACKQYTGASQ